jgi:signal transduction histidine kinase
MRIHNSLSSRISENRSLSYILAVVVPVAASLLIRLAHLPSDSASFILLLMAVVFSAWYCGVVPSILSTLICLADAILGFPIHQLSDASRRDWLGIAALFAGSVLVIAMGETRRRQNAALLKAQEELEMRVQERTEELAVLNRNLRELSARLMQLQDDERRRIARELHDSVGQTLAALAMNLSLVKSDLERLTRVTNALTDSENLVRDMSTEVRTISHLLHPPLLDEAGLASALRWYLDGFAQRSKITVDLDLPDDFGRLPRELETAIFRIVQESLTNIHRHSESPVARIRLRQRKNEVLVQVEDKGRGIPLEKQELMATSGTPGVGIRGMRERLRQLGGSLEIESSSDGTLVTGKLPTNEIAGADEVSLAGPAAA